MTSWLTFRIVGGTESRRTENAFGTVVDPPPGGEFVTVTLRKPGAAPRAIDIFAVKWPKSLTAIEFIKTLSPKLTVVVPVK